MALVIDIFRKSTFKTHVSLKSTNATGHCVSHGVLSLFELPSRTRHKNLSHRVFVMGLTYFINMLSSDVSDMLVDSSAPGVNLLTKDSFMDVPVLLS